MAFPFYFIFRWFPTWTRDRVRFWGEACFIGFTLGWVIVFIGARPSFQFQYHKPSWFYRRKLERMLAKGDISRETYERHMGGLPFFRPPAAYRRPSELIDKP